jgi:hypothetical protein
MSIILKGIDLPKKGTVINLIVQSDGEAQYIILGDGEQIVVKEAEAIQIPKGHGDIKDIDQITKLLPKIYLGGVSHMVINDAPTILEAEEE